MWQLSSVKCIFTCASRSTTHIGIFFIFPWLGSWTHCSAILHIILSPWEPPLHFAWWRLVLLVPLGWTIGLVPSSIILHNAATNVAVYIPLGGSAFTSFEYGLNVTMSGLSSYPVCCFQEVSYHFQNTFLVLSVLEIVSFLCEQPTSPFCQSLLKLVSSSLAGGTFIPTPVTLHFQHHRPPVAVLVSFWV